MKGAKINRGWRLNITVEEKDCTYHDFEVRTTVLSITFVDVMNGALA
jgi:hypothetical protein